MFPRLGRLIAAAAILATSAGAAVSAQATPKATAPQTVTVTTIPARLPNPPGAGGTLVTNGSAATTVDVAADNTFQPNAITTVNGGNSTLVGDGLPIWCRVTPGQSGTSAPVTTLAGGMLPPPSALATTLPAPMLPVGNWVYQTIAGVLTISGYSAHSRGLLIQTIDTLTAAGSAYELLHYSIPLNTTTITYEPAALPIITLASAAGANTLNSYFVPCFQAQVSRIFTVPLSHSDTYSSLPQILLTFQVGGQIAYIYEVDDPTGLPL